jgi:putative intracellular protease/amidase
MRTIAVLAYPGVQILDVTGPLEVFARAERSPSSAGRRRSPVSRAGPRARGGPLRSVSGVGLVADRAFGTVTSGIDTLLVAGGRGGTRP